MASRSYEGRYKAWLLTATPADFASTPKGDRVVTASELSAGTRLLRLVSDGGVTYTYTMNTASQALIDEGIVSHSVGTREVTGGQIIHQIDHPLADDAMWNLYEYGDARHLIICPDCPGETPADEAQLHWFQIETGEPQTMAPGRDTKQNFQVGWAVQDWDFKVSFEAA